MMNVRASFYDQEERSGTRVGMPRNEALQCVFYFCIETLFSFLCPGSIPERDGDKLYNTCTVFSPTGTMLGKYRKVSVAVVCVVLFLHFGCRTTRLSVASPS